MSAVIISIAVFRPVAYKGSSQYLCNDCIIYFNDNLTVMINPSEYLANPAYEVSKEQRSVSQNPYYNIVQIDDADQVYSITE